MRRPIVGLSCMFMAVFFAVSVFCVWPLVTFLSRGGDYVVEYIEATESQVTAASGDSGEWWGFIIYPDGARGDVTLFYDRVTGADSFAEKAISVAPRVSYIEVAPGDRVYRWSAARWTLDVGGDKNTSVIEQNLIYLASGSAPTIDYQQRLHFCQRFAQTNHKESMDYISRHAPYLAIFADAQRFVVSLWAYALAAVGPGLAGMLEYAWVIGLSALATIAGRTGRMLLRQANEAIPNRL